MYHTPSFAAAMFETDARYKKNSKKYANIYLVELWLPLQETRSDRGAILLRAPEIGVQFDESGPSYARM